MSEKKSGKSHRSGQYGEESTSKQYNYDPDKLVLVTDKAHPLYDERVHNKIDEAMVLNIMAEGVHEPVIIRLNGKGDDGLPIAEVVDGKQRTINAREANRRLREAGKQIIYVPCVLKKADTASLFGVLITTNELRSEDTPMNKARKLQRYLAMGRTEEQAAITFGVTLQTIKNWTQLFQLHPDVQKAVERGIDVKGERRIVPMTIAKELKDVPQEKQPEVLEKLIASGNIKGARGVEAARNVRKNGEAKSSKARMMTKVVLADWRKKLKDGGGKEAEVAYAVVSYILGHERALANHPRLRELLDAAQE